MGSCRLSMTYLVFLSVKMHFHIWNEVYIPYICSTASSDNDKLVGVFLENGDLRTRLIHTPPQFDVYITKLHSFSWVLRCLLTILVIAITLLSLCLYKFLYNVSMYVSVVSLNRVCGIPRVVYIFPSKSAS